MSLFTVNSGTIWELSYRHLPDLQLGTGGFVILYIVLWVHRIMCAFIVFMVLRPNTTLATIPASVSMRLYCLCHDYKLLRYSCYIEVRVASWLIWKPS